MASLDSHAREYLSKELKDAGIEPRVCICAYSESGRANCTRMVRDMSQIPALRPRCGYVRVPKAPKETKAKRQKGPEAAAAARSHRRESFARHLGQTARTAIAQNETSYVALWHFHPLVTAEGTTSNRGYELPISISQETAQSVNDQGFSYTRVDRIPKQEGGGTPTYAPVPNYSAMAQRRDIATHRNAAGLAPPAPPAAFGSGSASSSSAASASGGSAAYGSGGAASGGGSGPSVGLRHPTHTRAPNLTPHDVTPPVRRWHP